jgi:hypothetical protein
MPKNKVTDPITDQEIAFARLDREQVLDRLWEIANLSPDVTRGSINGQVKALSMIIAMENFIPARSQKKSTPAPSLAPGSVEVPTNRVSPSKAPLPYVPLSNSVPDLGVAFPMPKNPFVHPR